MKYLGIRQKKQQSLEYVKTFWCRNYFKRGDHTEVSLAEFFEELPETHTLSINGGNPIELSHESYLEFKKHFDGGES